MLTVAEIHERYGVPESTVYYLVREGRLPAINEAQPWHSRQRLKIRLSDAERLFGRKAPPAES